MILKDYHVHSSFCDGADTPEKIVKSAIENRIDTLGILTHSYTFFDESYCIKKDRYGEFVAEISRLKAKYKGKINLLCGVEQDVYSTAPTEGFDYIISSAHYVKVSEEYLSIDESREKTAEIAKKYFGGDFYAFAEEYYKTVSLIAEKKTSIIGHFDLISKFNENECLFSETNERYVNSFKSAADKLLSLGIPFEINTGAISRGYKTAPYPSADIRKYILSKGGSFILSSDAHSKDTLCFMFGEIKI